MSTSPEERQGPPGLSLRVVGYADPVAHQLIEAVQQEYVVRYGGRDAASVDPAEFTPPSGLFLVAEVGGEPAGCGGWRRHAATPGTAELKRMFVVPAFRRRGLAATLLAELERTAAVAGASQLVLNTGDKQPEALALYAAAGYAPTRGYGFYADVPGAVFLVKELAGGRDEEERP